MSEAVSDVIIGVCSFPNEEDARTAAGDLLQSGLCASFSLMPAMQTLVVHDDEVSAVTEYLCLLRTTAGRFAQVEARLRELHSYESPEIYALHPAHMSEVFGRWVASELSRWR